MRGRSLNSLHGALESRAQDGRPNVVRKDLFIRSEYCKKGVLCWFKGSLQLIDRGREVPVLGGGQMCGVCDGLLACVEHGWFSFSFTFQRES